MHADCSVWLGQYHLASLIMRPRFTWSVVVWGPWYRWERSLLSDTRHFQAHTGRCPGVCQVSQDQNFIKVSVKFQKGSNNVYGFLWCHDSTSDVKVLDNHDKSEKSGFSVEVLVLFVSVHLSDLIWYPNRKLFTFQQQKYFVAFFTPEKNALSGEIVLVQMQLIRYVFIYSFGHSRHAKRYLLTWGWPEVLLESAIMFWEI